MAAIATATREDGEEDALLLWVLVWSELIVFGILLTAFIVMSGMDVVAFDLARLHLSPGLAAVNTVILLLSGWQAAVAMRRRADLQAVRRPLVAAAVFGLAFVAVKLVEYSGELRFTGDATLRSFFELYFIITGFHLLHVLFGSAVLVLVAWRPTHGNVVLIALLWHAIDLVWLVMFPIIYLA